MDTETGKPSYPGLAGALANFLYKRLIFNELRVKRLYFKSPCGLFSCLYLSVKKVYNWLFWGLKRVSKFEHDGIVAAWAMMCKSYLFSLALSIDHMRLQKCVPNFDPLAWEVCQEHSWIFWDYLKYLGVFSNTRYIFWIYNK